MLQAELKILGGKHQGKSIPLSTKKFLVGREQDCHLRPNSDMVSRHHCVFSIDDYAVRLRDLGSTNGTRVNGEALRGEVMLKSGDQIGIGKMELELVIRQAVAVAVKPSGLMSGSSGEMDAIPSGVTVEIPAFAGDSNAEISETSFEMPAVAETAAQNTVTNLASDTTIVPGAAPAGYPGYAPMVAPGFPGMMPQGYPAMPGYVPQPGYAPPPMGYPQQYPPQYQQYPPGYGQPVYPNMAGYPMGLPAAPGYAMPAPAEPEPAAASSEAAVKLPPPESTGFKQAPPPVVAAPANPAEAGAAPKTEEKPSTSAADIIKQYMQKRTR